MSLQSGQSQTHIEGLAERLRMVNDRIARAAERSGRSVGEITLVAVSKTYPFSMIEALVGAGQFHFGENRVQELVPKMELGDRSGYGHDETRRYSGKIVWHMIGALQSNKVRHMASRVDWIHSVPKLKTLLEIDRRAADAGRTINVLIQVNISDEDQKSGCDPSELKQLLLEARSLTNVRVSGLMGMASLVDDPEEVRPQFALLRKLKDEYREFNEGSLQLDHLSMGMSHDLEVAIEEGATIVRVGSAIFG